jgi:hypothetical protein
MAKDDKTKVYTAVQPIRHSGELYAPGDPIELSDAHAAPLLLINHVEAAKAVAPAKGAKAEGAA